MLKTILASALAVSMAVPTVGAFAATPSDCALKQVAAAQPLRERVQLGGRIFRDRLAGATTVRRRRSCVEPSWR